MSNNNPAAKPTTDLSITPQEEIVQFLWRAPKPGDAGIIIGGTPSNPLRRKALFYVVLDIKPILSNRYKTALASCLVTDRVQQTTVKDEISIQYFITADKPVPDLFTPAGLRKLQDMIGGFASRYLVDYKIIV